MNFKVIKDNPERAYNTELERQAKKHRKTNERTYFSYCTKIGKSPQPPQRSKPMGWEPESWNTP